MGKINILGVHVDAIDMNEAVAKVKGFLENDGANAVFTPNSEIMMAAYRDEKFKDILNSAEMIIADGVGVVYASRILKRPLPERVAGFDLACRTLEEVSDGSKSVYFFGGKPGVCELAIENLKKKYPDLYVSGFSDGYFDDEKEKKIIEDIKEKKPDILFVCLGAPKQELWISKHKDELGAKVLLGVGGTLDVLAGTAKRAPVFFQKTGLEWLYRLLKQPKRIGRMLDLPKFGFTVLLKGKKFPQED